MKWWRLGLIILLIFTSYLLGQDDLEKKLNTRVSVNFQKTSITDVLRILASQNSINLVIGEGITGDVTVQLNNVTLSDALSTILKSHGYHYIIQNGIVLVKPFNTEVNGELTTEIIQLKYLDGFEVKTTIEPLLSPKGKVEALLSEKVKDEFKKRSDILVINDVWENVQMIRKVVEEMDKEPVQFQIEVKLVESLLGSNKQVGFNWPKRVSTSVTGAELTAPITQSTSTTQQEQRYLSAWYELPELGENVTLGVLTADELKATLEFLAQDNRNKLVSNPKITALNNRTAIIQIGTTVPVPEISRGVGGDLISYREKEVSMYLEVIPRINEGNVITLVVHPVLEEIVGYTGPSDFPQPITSKREVSTEVRVCEGQTVVIGGLIKESNNKVVEKIWLLGDIPLLGYLFRHTTVRKEKTDLLIFITPKIIK